MSVTQIVPVTVETLNFLGRRIRVQEETGLMSATDMTKSCGKDWFDFIRNKDHVEFLRATSRKTKRPIGIPKIEVLKTAEFRSSVAPLVTIDKNPHSPLHGTWVGDRVALRLASWLDKDLEAEIYDFYYTNRYEKTQQVQNPLEILGEFVAGLVMKSEAFQEGMTNIAEQVCNLFHKNTAQQLISKEISNFLQSGGLLLPESKKDDFKEVRTFFSKRQAKNSGFLIPQDLGDSWSKNFKRDSRQINKWLKSQGLQEYVEKRWIPTDKARGLYAYYHFSNSHNGYSDVGIVWNLKELKWYDFANVKNEGSTL
jgi:hypothetical protein